MEFGILLLFLLGGSQQLKQQEVRRKGYIVQDIYIYTPLQAISRKNTDPQRDLSNGPGSFQVFLLFPLFSRTSGWRKALRKKRKKKGAAAAPAVCVYKRGATEGQDSSLYIASRVVCVCVCAEEKERENKYSYGGGDSAYFPVKAQALKYSWYIYRERTNPGASLGRGRILATNKG